MWDFGRLSSVGLWKSGPLFSTGIKEAKLVVSELRLNLQATPARFAGSQWSDTTGKVDRGDGPRLSTAFAERQGHPSPRASILIQSPNRASGQGE